MRWGNMCRNRTSAATVEEGRMRILWEGGIKDCVKGGGCKGGENVARRGCGGGGEATKKTGARCKLGPGTNYLYTGKIIYWKISGRKIFPGKNVWGCQGIAESLAGCSWLGAKFAYLWVLHVKWHIFSAGLSHLETFLPCRHFSFVLIPSSKRIGTVYIFG